MREIKIDLKVLEKLWNGELFPAEHCRPGDEEYRKMVANLDAIHMQLLKEISGDNQGEKFLECYEQQLSAMAEREHLEAFKTGFFLALGMVIEMLLEKE